MGDPKIGVFICRCGTNIAATVDVEALAAFAKTLPGVGYVDVGKWICSVDYLAKLSQAVGAEKLDRVVVACCTPRTHEPTFRSTVREAGLNPYLLEFVSIREQVSWVHRSDRAAALAKAKDLVRMGVAKAMLLEPAEEVRIPVGRSSLVIGGGPAGMSAALALALQGFEVFLVERSAELGGLLNRLHGAGHGEKEPAVIAREMAAKVMSARGIEVIAPAEVTGLKGYVGNYEAELSNGRKIGVSTIIVATGMAEIDAGGLFGAKPGPRVVTQLGLEGMLKDGFPAGIRSVVILNCAGSRNAERGCCHVGCAASLRNAEAVLAANPSAKVTVLYRDLTVVGNESMLRGAAAGKGVRFVRYSSDAPPAVRERGELLEVSVRDLQLGEEVVLDADLVVLTVGFTGDRSVERLKGLLKVSADSEGFFKEAHIKLRPLDFPADGVYLAGCARSPRGIRESIEDGAGAAMRASIPMRRGYVEAEGTVAVIDLESCSGCMLCAKGCPYGAIEMKDEKPSVISALCKGCGTCAAGCPKDAVQIIHYTDAQIMAQVEAALLEDPAAKIVAFCCHWCAMGAVDIAGVGRLEYPPNVRIIRVMCSARVDEDHVMKALDMGAAGVLVMGCEFPTCHYIAGNADCRKRMEKLSRKLEKKGVDTGRLATAWLSAAQGRKFAKTVREFAEKLGLSR